MRAWMGWDGLGSCFLAQTSPPLLTLGTPAGCRAGCVFTWCVARGYPCPGAWHVLGAVTKMGSSAPLGASQTPQGGAFVAQSTQLVSIAPQEAASFHRPGSVLGTAACKTPAWGSAESPPPPPMPPQECCQQQGPGLCDPALSLTPDILANGSEIRQPEQRM